MIKIKMKSKTILPLIALISFFFSINTKADEPVKPTYTPTVSHRAVHGSYPPPKETVQRHDLTHEELVDFKHHILSENSIKVSFGSGDPSCYGSRFVLEEKDDSIGIAVITGAIPGGLDICTMVGTSNFFVLHTKNPIGNRKIVPLTSVNFK